MPARPRTYTVEPLLHHDGLHRGFSFRTYRVFQLHLTGHGHWCEGAREAGKFPLREEAETAGRIWVETGLQPYEQTPERIAARREALERGIAA